MLHDTSASKQVHSSAGRLTRRGLLRLGAVGVVGTAATALLAACGESQVVTVEKLVTQTVVKEVPVERVVEKVVTVEKMMAPKQQTVTVYSGRSESLVAPVLDQFGEISGVDVRIKYAGTRPWLPRSWKKAPTPPPTCSTRRTPVAWARWNRSWRPCPRTSSTAPPHGVATPTASG